MDSKRRNDVKRSASTMETAQPKIKYAWSKMLHAIYFKRIVKHETSIYVKMIIFCIFLCTLLVTFQLGNNWIPIYIGLRFWKGNTRDDNIARLLAYST